MVNKEDVCVKDSSGSLLDIQLSPVYNITQHNALDLGVFQLVFVGLLPALSLSTFNIVSCSGQENLRVKKTQVYCLMCPDSSVKEEDDVKPFSLSPLPEGVIQLENQVYTLQFDSSSRLLTSITNKLSGGSQQVLHSFIGYPSQPFRSGAYLLSVETSYAAPVFSASDLIDVVIVSGVIWSQLTLMWKVGGEAGASTFVTSYRLYHTTGSTSEAVYLENSFDFGPAPNMRDTELVMRFSSQVKSGRSFFTDQSGLGMIRRDWQESLPLSANHFPVTQATYLEDAEHRLSLLVDHATGASSVEEGVLEVMVDRRTMYDDARGMGEGVTDSRATVHGYWLMLEPRDPGSVSSSPDTAPSLSPLASQLSRYLDNPSTVMSSSSPLHSSVSLINSPLPCDHHLINLRSWSPRSSSSSDSSALMILQRTGSDCSWATLTLTDCINPGPSLDIVWSQHSAQYSPVTLTGNFQRSTDGSDIFKLSPMEIAAYNVTLTS